MSKHIISLDKYLPSIVQELICIECKYRFIDVRPQGLWLKDMECPQCGNVGYIVATGQILNDE